MKRKRAQELDELCQETLKPKKPKSQTKVSEDHNSESEENDHERADTILQSRLKNPKKKGMKSISRMADAQPLTMENSAETKNKRTKRQIEDFNQNGVVSNDIESMEKSKFSISTLKKKKKNGIQAVASLNTASDLKESVGGLKDTNLTIQEQDDEITGHKTNIVLPVKKKRGRKPGIHIKTENPKNDIDKNYPSQENIDINPIVRHGVLKTTNKDTQVTEQTDPLTKLEGSQSIPKKTKKKVRIDETESLKVKKELAEAESHFSVKELPAKIIKSKSNKSLTEEVKVSPLTVQSSKRDRKNMKKIKSDTKSVSISSNKSGNNTERGHAANGLDYGSNLTSEESDLEVFYINKNAEKEAKKKSLKKHSIAMPKEDQLILVQKMQDFIPEGDTKSYKYRLQQVEWQNVVFKDYSLEECQNVWAQLLKKVRHYRLLMEITNDLKQIIELSDVEEAKPGKKNVKNQKHPDMPKRPLSSYFLYYIRKRDKIGKERPDLDSIELNKFISEKYQNLSLEKKQKYELLAAKNREEYKKQLEEFYEKHPEMRKVVIKKEPKERKEQPPKRPVNPYKLFMLSELSREEIAEDDKAEFKEVCREKWRQMSDSKKLGWINLAEEHHMKYEEELKEYMARHPEYTPKSQTPRSILSRQEMNLKDKLAGKPKKPPGTAYGLFISMTLQSSEIVDIPPRERWNYTSIKWKAMTDEEREQYKQLLAQVNEQYQKEFKIYLDSLPEDKRQEEIEKSLPKKRKNAATAGKPSKSGTKPKASPTKSQPSRAKNSKQKVQNPTPPPRSAYKYFAEKYDGENPKEAWKNLSSQEKEKYEEELSIIKDKYIKDFEAYLKSLTKDELATFCAKRNSQEEYPTSDESDSESEHGDEESSDESQDSSDSENDSEEN